MVPEVHHQGQPEPSLSPLGCLSGALTAPGGARECYYGNTESFWTSPSNRFPVSGV